MKHHLTLILAFCTSPLMAGLFGPDEETIELRKRVAEQQDDNTLLIIIVGVLIAVAMVTFIVGAILGSRTRRKEKDNEPSG